MENIKKSLDVFFRSEYNKLLNYVRKNTGYQITDDSPEDIVQEVALNLLDRIDINTQIENLAAYIYRSLRNKIIDKSRQNKKTISIDHYDTNQQSLLFINSIPDGTGIESTDQSISYVQLYEAILRLKPDEQSIIMLTEFEGKSFTELSQKWNIPIGTLLSRKHRALFKLSKILLEKNTIKTIKINENGNRTKLSKKTLAL